MLPTSLRKSRLQPLRQQVEDSQRSIVRFESETYYEPDDWLPDDLDSATCDSLRRDHTVRCCPLVTLYIMQSPSVSWAAFGTKATACSSWCALLWANTKWGDWRGRHPAPGFRVVISSAHCEIGSSPRGLQLHPCCRKRAVSQIMVASAFGIWTQLIISGRRRR